MALRPHLRRPWVWLLLGMLVVAPLMARWTWAQAAATGKASQGAGPSWDSLSATQRQALGPLARDWAGFNELRKAKWLDVAARYEKLSPDEQQRLQERMVEWAKLSSAERSRARLTFQENKQLTPEEKQARWDAYNTLTDDHRKAIVEYGKRPETPVAPTPNSTKGGMPSPARSAFAPESAPPPRVNPVSPTLVQAKPGATTMPISKATTPGNRPQTAPTRIIANDGRVDRSTLLPINAPRAAAPAAPTPSVATAASATADSPSTGLAAVEPAVAPASAPVPKH